MSYHYEDCGHRCSNGICEFNKKYCERENSSKSCYESEFVVKRTLGITAKEKRIEEETDILTRLKNREKVYKASHCEETSDYSLIVDAIKEIERLYAILK